MTSQGRRGICTSEGWKCNGDMEETVCDKACRCLVVNFTMKVRKRVHPQIDKYWTQREWCELSVRYLQKGSLVEEWR